MELLRGAMQGELSSPASPSNSGIDGLRSWPFAEPGHGEGLARALEVRDAPAPASIRIGGVEFSWGRKVYVMGIINLSPDSFSGDGLGDDLAAAVETARRWEEQGADIIDVGGESTRPDYAPITVEEEIKRVVPAIRAIACHVRVPMSVDTSKGKVAEAALGAGASAINDVWGLRVDPVLAEVAARTGVPLVLTHNSRPLPGVSTDAAQAPPRTGGDIVAAVAEGLRHCMERAKQAGAPEQNLIIDPGIGFGKTWQQNLEILHRLDELRRLGRPILIGTSRKSFIGQVLGLPVTDRTEGSVATAAMAALRGANIVRVHDVAATVRALTALGARDGGESAQ